MFLVQNANLMLGAERSMSKNQVSLSICQDEGCLSIYGPSVYQKKPTAYFWHHRMKQYESPRVLIDRTQARWFVGGAAQVSALKCLEL